MDNKPTIGDKVVLKTFLGITNPPENCDPSENYWKLIGQCGTIVADLAQSDRVVVVFDNSVSGLGLHCHNPEPNSLRIKWTDLDPA